MAGLVGVNTIVDSNGSMSVYTQTGSQIVAGSSTQTFTYSPTTNTITNGAGSDVTDGFHTGAITADLNYLRSEEHTSELQSLMRISYAVFCLKKKKTKHIKYQNITNNIYQTQQLKPHEI